MRWFDAQDATALFVSVLTLGEIEKGVSLLPASRKKAALTSWLGTRQTATGGEQEAGQDGASPDCRSQDLPAFSGFFDLRSAVLPPSATTGHKTLP